MQNLSHYFIHSSNNLSLSFIIISFILILFFVIISLVIKFKKINNKFINSRNLVFLATILGLIIAIIYGSFIDYSKLTKQIITNNIWVWDCISFVFSFGALFVSLLFLSCWLFVPIVAFKMVKKFLLEINKTSALVELKKILLILMFMIITIAFSNLGWVIPLNDPKTPLTIFNENNHLLFHDQWYLANRFMYEKCYLTAWYPWVFLVYLIAVLLIMLIFVKMKYKNVYQLERIEHKISKIGSFFHIFDSFSVVSSYCFIASYFLFNWIYLFIHIGYSLLVLFLSYLTIILILLLIYKFKDKNQENKIIKPLNLFKISFINHFSFDDNKKVSIKSFNLTDFSVVALSFTLYMGFSSNFDFSTSYNNEIIFNYKMHSFPFWLQAILSCLILNIISDNNSYNSSVSKLLVAQATYSVTPGLQTGILTWYNPLFKPFSDFINSLSYELIQSNDRKE